MLPFCDCRRCSSTWGASLSILRLECVMLDERALPFHLGCVDMLRDCNLPLFELWGRSMAVRVGSYLSFSFLARFFSSWLCLVWISAFCLLFSYFSCELFNACHSISFDNNHCLTFCLLCLVCTFAFCLLKCLSLSYLSQHLHICLNAKGFPNLVTCPMVSPGNHDVLPIVPLCPVWLNHLPRVYTSLYTSLKCMRSMDLPYSGLHALLPTPVSESHPSVYVRSSDQKHRFEPRFPSISEDFSSFDFDSSLGFPGEGPWSIMSANIDSFQTHADCTSWETDVVALQETRLTKNNIEHSKKRALEHGKDIFHGDLLVEKKDSNGFFKTPHGGAAFLAAPEASRSFHKDDDVTGIWDKIVKTTRVAGCWHQVLPKMQVLVFSFYGQACLPHDAHLEVNQQLLADLFIVASQFGSIPVLIAGDFQNDPDTYPAIVDAKALGHWSDPLVQPTDQGENSRPITFSRNGNFKNPSEHYSSIDGILVNDIALSALVDIRVCFEHSKQHAPIKASFSWPNLYQKGFVHIKPAAFDLSNIPHDQGSPIDLNPIASQIWHDKYDTRFDCADDETAWSIVNNFAIDTLVTAGAKFGRGPKTRGQQPTFKQVVKFPGQHKSGNAHSKLSNYLSKTFQLVTELRFRFSRCATKHTDFINTWNLQQKVFCHLQKIDSCKWWNPNFHHHDDALKCVLSCLQDSIIKARNHEKRNRIAEWKRKMSQGTKSKQVGKMVFKWIKSKASNPSPNLIRDPQGNIIVDPVDAINEINDQWDSVYAVNALHADPMEVLKFAWPYIQETRKVADIPMLTGADLQSQALRRKIDAAPGLDGWRTCEMKMLPCAVYNAAAEYFRKVEQGARQLPECLVLARQIILDKKGDSPLQKRLISLLPIFLLCYTSLRFRHLQSWQMMQLPPQLFGGIKGRKMNQLQTQLRLTIDNAKSSGQHLIGVKLDKAKCFDRIVPTIASALMIAFGVPSPVVMMFSQIYVNLRRLLSYKGWISTSPTTCANSVIQGCSMSLVAINVHMALWIKLIDKLPNMFAAVYVDDSYLWTHLDNCRILREAIEITTNWDTLTGQLANHCKSSAWATNTVGRKLLIENFPEMSHDKIIEVLGARLNTTEQANTAWDSQKTTKILRDLKSIKALPCPIRIKEHIIGMKITPQLAFTPHLSKVPKKDLKLVQDQLASIVWKNRPMWRCRWLIIALLADPHSSDPFFARAYNTILETVYYLKHCTSDERRIWQTQCETRMIKPNSLLNCFRQACTLLEITHPQAFHLSFFETQPVCFLDFGRKELQHILKVVVRHRCYKCATEIKRKDVKPCRGILNFPLTKKTP